MADFPNDVWAGWALTDLVDYWTADRANAIAGEVVAIENNLRRQNFVATTAPGVGDDSADGYKVGSLWYDVTADKIYGCVDNTAGAAVWRLLSTLSYADISDFNTGVRSNRLDQMAAPTAAVAMNSQRVSGVAAATTAGDAVTAGAALTSGYIPVIDASGRIIGTANIYRDATTGNLMIGTTTDITGGTLQVNGGVVVSDGAGGTKAKITSGGMLCLLPQTLTIAGGAITATASKILVNTEGAAASDDLVTINGYEDGALIVVSPGTTSQTIVLKQNGAGTGGLYNIGSADVSLTSRAHVATYMYSNTLNRWVMLAAKTT